MSSKPGHVEAGGRGAAPREFALGLVIAGGGSAGAYLAGVVDFLLEALEEWEKARLEGGLGPGQDHHVRIMVIAGTSAGAMTTGILARTLCAVHEPARDLSGDGPRPMANRLYDCWVRQIDVRDLLGTTDFDSGDGSGELLSFFDSTKLGRIAETALDVEPRPLPAYVAGDLSLHIPVTNLRGVPYAYDFRGDGGEVAYGMMRHADHVSFQFGAQPGDCHVPLDPAETGAVGGWKRLIDTAIASGAFPIGLSARKLERDPNELRNRDPVPDWFAAPPKSLTDPEAVRKWQEGRRQPDPEFQFVCVDGGVIDNEPVGLARADMTQRECRFQEESADADVNAALLLVDPFPNRLPDEPNPYPLPLGWLPVTMRMLAAVLNQLRFKPDELRAARSPDRFDQFMIAPSYPGKDKAIAADAFAGFGAFLAEDLRKHDFQLGRRNCQHFLREHFKVPANCRVFGPAAAASASGGKVPIVPLVGSADVEVPEPGRSGLKLPDVDDVGARLWNRLRRVAKAIVDKDAAAYLGGGLARFLAKSFVSAVVIPRAVRGAKCAVEEALAGFGGARAGRKQPEEERAWIGYWLGATLLFVGLLAWLGRGLQTPEAMQGILSYEFAGSSDCGCGLFLLGTASDTSCVSDILASWSDRLATVRWHLYLDYGLMVAYAGLLVQAGRSTARTLKDARRSLLRIVALAAAVFGVAAALADAVENYYLLAMVEGWADYGSAVAATWAARIKFWLLFAAFAALVLCWAWILCGRARIDKTPAAEAGRP